MDIQDNSSLVSENPQLLNLDGLASLTTVGRPDEPTKGFVSITFNAKLPQCTVDALEAQLMSYTSFDSLENDSKGSCD